MSKAGMRSAAGGADFLAGAWVGKDMGWVVATLQREGVNEKGFEDLVSHMEWGEAAQAILRNVDKLEGVAGEEWWMLPIPP